MAGDSHWHWRCVLPRPVTRRIRALAIVGLIGLGAQGCAVVGITGATLGASALSGGMGVAMRAGTEYRRDGVVFRTFTAPLPELRMALGTALARMEIAVVEDEQAGDVRRIEARARDRKIHIELQPVTRTVTRLRLAVAEGLFRKDRATAGEIVAQAERIVDGVASASIR